MKTIVVGYDETDPAKRALERAADLAQAFGAALIVTSVAPLLASGPRGGGPIPWDSPELHGEELRHARDTLAERKLSAEFIPAAGEVADAIVEIADERGADLIVVGSQHGSAIGRAIYGTVSGRVSRHAHCDVLIVQ